MWHFWNYLSHSHLNLDAEKKKKEEEEVQRVDAIPQDPRSHK